MGWVFLPIGDRDELLLFLGPGWNVFLCWTTKNSHQRWDDYDDKDKNDRRNSGGTLRQKFNLIDIWTNGPMDQWTWTNGIIDQWTNGPMDQ